jgi:Mn-dependent DtxR family transcriptional regulator
MLLTKFLKSCAEDLEKEAKDKGEQISEAVDRELRDIARHLQGNQNSAMQRAILGATLAFYERLGAHVSADADNYQHSVQSALDEVVSEIATIKV